MVEMITVIMEGESSSETLIYTTDGPDPIRVMETYEKVKKQFEHFNYKMHTVIEI